MPTTLCCMHTSGEVWHRNPPTGRNSSPGATIQGMGFQGVLASGIFMKKGFPTWKSSIRSCLCAIGSPAHSHWCSWWIHLYSGSSLPSVHDTGFSSCHQTWWLFLLGGSTLQEQMWREVNQSRSPIEWGLPEPDTLELVGLHTYARQAILYILIHISE